MRPRCATVHVLPNPGTCKPSPATRPLLSCHPLHAACHRLPEPSSAVARLPVCTSPTVPVAAPSGCPSLPQVERLKEDRDRLRDELDARDGEVMQLQGQLVMLRNQVADEANWLSPLPDPYA